VTQQKLQLVIQDEMCIHIFDSWVRTTKHSMERTNRSKLSFHYTV